MLDSQSQNVPTVTHGEAYSLMTLPEFNLSELQSLFDQAKVAYTNKHYSDAIKHCTHILHTLYNDVLPTIHLHCASAYEMRHQYDSALTESRYASHHPDTYFAQASAYYFQHKYAEAAHTYKRGMDTLLPERYPHQHNVLVQKHRLIQNEIDKRNQWIRQLLPYEVLSRILSLVSLKDRMQLAKTCRFWNRFLMKSDMMWSHIDMKNDFKRCSTTTAVNQLFSIVSCSQVKSITVCFPENDNIPPSRPITAFDPDMQDALHAFVNDDDVNLQGAPNRFIPAARALPNPSISQISDTDDFLPSLDLLSQGFYSWIISEQKVLHLESLEITNYCEYRLCKILEACKRSLKQLRLIDCNNSDYAKHALIDVVRICPNLRSLTITGRFNYMEEYHPPTPTTIPINQREQQVRNININIFNRQQLFPPASPSSSTASLAMLPQLNTLSLIQLTLAQNVKDSLLAEILKKSPKLSCLALPLWGGERLANALNIIRTHSPQLHSFRYGRILSRKGVTYSENHHQHHSTHNISQYGLKELEIYLMDDIIISSNQIGNILDQLQALLQQNRNALQIVRFVGGFLSHSSIDLTLLAGKHHQHGLPWLRFLELEQTQANDAKLLVEALRTCPLLEHVDLRFMYEGLCNEQTIEALASLKYLRRLSIDIKAKGWQISDTKVLYNLFKENNNSHLEDFTLHFLYKHTSPYMQHQFMIELAKAVARSSRLCRLDIQGIWLSQGTLETFLMHLQDSHVRVLSLSLCRGDETNPYPEPFSKTEMEALASIQYLGYIQINDTEKIMLEAQLRQFLNTVVNCNRNQQSLFVVRVENVHPDRRPLVGCIKRQLYYSKDKEADSRDDEQQGATIQLYVAKNISGWSFSPVDQDYVNAKLRHKLPPRRVVDFFNTRRCSVGEL